jgi:hypothetical protein
MNLQTKRDVASQKKVDIAEIHARNELAVEDSRKLLFVVVGQQPFISLVSSSHHIVALDSNLFFNHWQRHPRSPFFHFFTSIGIL